MFFITVITVLFVNYYQVIILLDLEYYSLVLSTIDGSSLCSYKICQEASDLSRKSGKPYLCSHGQVVKESSSSLPELVVHKEAFRYQFCFLSFHCNQIY